jgi:acyl-coenzyme A thioesterase PaaI-like protein
MQVKDIPFANFIGIKQSKEELSLEYKKDLYNHIESIHASAQFTLAETQSGLYLQELFPKLVGKVIPVLREANIKYKKVAKQKIIAYAKVRDEDIQKFKEQYEKKGRALLEIFVEVKDINEITTSQGSFIWFVQKVESIK